MTKKNHETAALRTAADAAVATWRELDAVAKAKREACASFKPSKPFDYPRPRSSTELLRHTELDREALEAEEGADRARHAAVAALDALELAERDERALARDPRALRDDLAMLDAEDRNLTEKIADVSRRRALRMDAAFRADVEHAAGRNGAALPPSPPVPRVGQVGEITFRRTYLQGLAEYIEIGVPVPSKTAQITAARALEIRIAADLEEERLEKEAKAKDIADEKQFRDQEQERERQRVHAREQAQRNEIAAENRRREKLADDYRARHAS